MNLGILKITKNPHFEIIIGLVIMATGLIEAGDSIFADVTSGNVGARHGVILIGFAHAFQALPEVLGGVLVFSDGERREH